jgi:hypothetical protein
MDGSIVVFSIRNLQRSMAGNNIRQIAYDECQFDLRISCCMICQSSLRWELRKIFQTPKIRTGTATPLKPARNTSMDSRLSQFFPNDQNRMAPSKNAQIYEVVDKGRLLLFILSLSQTATEIADRILLRRAPHAQSLQ